MLQLSVAIDEISRQYVSGMFTWLEGENPLAMKQIYTLAAKIHAQILSGDEFHAMHTINIWKRTILFWNNTYKNLGGK